MKKLEPKSRRRVAVKALAKPGSPPRPSASAVNVSEGFRGARSALGQITADLERLRLHAASLVKSAHRQAK